MITKSTGQRGLALSCSRKDFIAIFFISLICLFKKKEEKSLQIASTFFKW